MIGVYICTVALLTLAWCILGESFSLTAVLTGVLVGTGCVLISYRYLPLYKIRGISVLWLLTYPVYMLAQLYIAAFSNIKMVLTSAKAEIIEVKTELSNDFLKVLLSHGATLTPGTITLDMNSDDTITFLCLRGRGILPENAGKAIKNIEKRLMRVEKKKREEKA